jgi:hypothetical protein
VLDRKRNKLSGPVRVVAAEADVLISASACCTRGADPERAAEGNIVLLVGHMMTSELVPDGGIPGVVMDKSRQGRSLRTGFRGQSRGPLFLVEPGLTRTLKKGGQQGC